VSAHGGFASKNNLAFAKGLEIKDAVFAKKRGLSVIDMAKSAWVYKILRNIRAGIETGISTLKRAFGLDRCKWSGWGGFKQYVWSSIVSCNLLVMARIRLARTRYDHPAGSNHPSKGAVRIDLTKNNSMN